MHDRLARSPRTLIRRLMLGIGAVFFFCAFLGLGTWQVFRLQWKLALIHRVNTRVHAAPVAAPGPALWPTVTASGDEYLHVRVTGSFLSRCTTPVQAVTALGSGYWLLTPLRRPDGSLYLVNRGFVPAAAVDAAREKGLLKNDEACDNPGSPGVTVTGLLRMTEPGGGFLHHNDPVDHRWYSRDVQAIAAARGLHPVAPYFIDADASSGSADQTPDADSFGQPAGGLTVIHFRNSHLAYAITWYTLALMVAGASLWVVRDERRLMRHAAGGKGDGDEAGDT